MRFNILKNGIHQTRISVATAPVIVASVDVCDCISGVEYNFITHRNKLSVDMRVPKSIYVAERTAREAVNAHRARVNRAHVHTGLDIQPELEWLRPVFLTWVAESYHKYQQIVVEAVEGTEIIHRVNSDGVHEFMVPMGYMEEPQELYHYLWALDTGALK